MPYQHGVRVQERATSIVAPITGTAGLQVVFGTAPINMADDPYKVTNTPVIAYNWAEAVSKLGYSEEKDEDGHYLYTLCAGNRKGRHPLGACLSLSKNLPGHKYRREGSCEREPLGFPFAFNHPPQLTARRTFTFPCAASATE